jgi:hypothetical protein
MNAKITVLKSVVAVSAFAAVLIFVGQGCQSSSGGGGGNDAAVNNPEAASQIGCPPNYVIVPASSTLGVPQFCVAKYEAKLVAGVPESRAADVPWTNLTRDQAKAACAAKGSGYALLDNAHWMSIARNIESVTWNFGGDPALQEYGPSRGISNNTGTTSFPASEDDNDACYLAMQSSSGPAAVCSLTVYDVARRVHKLSNDSLIWDFAGNASEWIADDLTASYATKSWILNLTDPALKSLFGPAGTYTPGPTNPTGNIYMSNFGYLNSDILPPYVIFRGGGFSYGRYAGIYTAYFAPPTRAAADTGFRCWYQPTRW